MILFTGGSIEEFDTPRLRNKLTTLLNSALPRGVVIGTFADAKYAALSSTDSFCGKSGQDGAVKFRSPAFQLGEVMEINDPKHALELVTRAKKRREQLRDQMKDPSAATSLSVTEAGILRKFSGVGRALIIVPFDDYNWQEYKAVRNALESDKHNMNVLIASSQFGSPRTNDDNATEFSTDITLDQFSPKYFDAVVFIGGDINGFDQEDTRRNLQRIVDGAMREGLVIASASHDSLELMKLTGIAEYLNESEKGKLRSGHPPKSAGSVVATEKYSYASTLVDKVIALRDQAIKHEQLGDTRKD